MVLHGWATRVFRRAGPYARSRNPMYLAGVPILAGVALLLGSVSPLSILLVYCAAASRWIEREEGALQVRFSGEWDTYRGTVRRWI